MAGVVALAVVLAAGRVHAVPPENATTLAVSIVDVQSGLPVAGADVRVVEVGVELAAGTSDARGELVLTVPRSRDLLVEGERERELHVDVAHLSYEPARASVGPRGTQRVVEIRLTPLEMIEITVFAHSDAFRPTTTLRGLKLQESLQSSVPETIANVPGVAVAYNGPAAAQPTIRGLGGDRVLMLEDGFRSGDLYWSASDHGVMIEPLTAERIDVVRGPATLAYGSNALGGVVNVVREDIPRRTEEVLVTMRAQAESASKGLAQGGSAVVPLGPIALRVEESVRRSADVQTPLGQLRNTGMEAFGGSAGLGSHSPRGDLGASLRYYQAEYGLPGEFGGQLIPGGHPGGAAVEARRANGRLDATYRPSTERFIERVELRASVTRYLHDESEGVVDGRRALGASFTLDTAQSQLIVRHRLELGGGSHSLRGATGVSVSSQDLLTGGSSPGVRSGVDRGLAWFVFEQLDVGLLSLHAGLRHEHRWLSPEETHPIRLRTSERTLERAVAARRFGLLSGSLALLWRIGDGWTVGSTLARSARAPNLQELYSDGPHLADYSFDIGTPSLPVETGAGADVFVRAELELLSLEATGFVNVVDDYVLYTPTLESVRVFREGERPRDTPVFEARAVDALFWGAEGTMCWRIGWGLSLSSTLSYVWAERRDDSSALPYIPPLHGRVTARYDLKGFFASVGASGAARQSRVPRPIAAGDGVARPQDPTAGYALAHASAGWEGNWLRMRHTLTARAVNLTNRVWRDHLSRIKDVAPQSGINLSLTYQLQY